MLYRARKFLDEDMQKIMLAVLTALQQEQGAEGREGREQGTTARWRRDRGRPGLTAGSRRFSAALARRWHDA